MNNFLTILRLNFSYYFNFDRVKELLLPYRSKKLRKSKLTDMYRWKKNNELNAEWNERTAILSDYIPEKSNILEFGAGTMFLKTYLNNYQSYTPVDIIKRYDETIVCDLNQSINFDISKYDVAVFSGVLEYVYDLDSVFEQLSKSVKQVVMSYCASDHFKTTREKNGWLSDYSKQELEAIFNKYNYEVIDYSEWKNQSIYNLVQANKDRVSFQ